MMHILFNIKYEQNTFIHSSLCEAYMQTGAEYANSTLWKQEGRKYIPHSKLGILIKKFNTKHNLRLALFKKKERTQHLKPTFFYSTEIS
jgi:hypothetical protein